MQSGRIGSLKFCLAYSKPAREERTLWRNSENKTTTHGFNSRTRNFRLLVDVKKQKKNRYTQTHIILHNLCTGHRFIRVWLIWI